MFLFFLCFCFIFYVYVLFLFISFLSQHFLSFTHTRSFTHIWALSSNNVVISADTGWGITGACNLEGCPGPDYVAYILSLSVSIKPFRSNSSLCVSRVSFADLV